MHRLPLLLILVCLMACHPGPTPEERPYEVNDNFLLTADVLMLQREQPRHSQPVDTLMGFTMLSRHDALVVAQLMTIPEDSLDSVWVKVAHDQQTMGWVHEGELLRSVVPDEPISLFLRFVRLRHGLLSLLIVGAAVAMGLWHASRGTAMPMVIVRDIPSAYPTMLLLMLSLAALLYAAMQRLWPQMWVHYYFHPALNPFEWPLPLALLLVLVWLAFILLIASLSVVSRLLPSRDAWAYALTLMASCALCFEFFSSPMPLALSSTLYLLFLVAALHRYFTHYHPRYLCGHCGMRMHSLGRCPRCGTLNRDLHEEA